MEKIIFLIIFVIYAVSYIMFIYQPLYSGELRDKDES